MSVHIIHPVHIKEVAIDWVKKEFRALSILAQDEQLSLAGALAGVLWVTSVKSVLTQHPGADLTGELSRAGYSVEELPIGRDEFDAAPQLEPVEVFAICRIIANGCKQLAGWKFSYARLILDDMQARAMQGLPGFRVAMDRIDILDLSSTRRT